MEEISDHSMDFSKLEIEDQFILRLPPVQAQKIRDALHKKPKKIKKMMALDVDVENKRGTVEINKKKIPGKLVTLPTIVESNKCLNNVHLFKTADISQMLICGNEIPEDENKENKKHEEKIVDIYPHGLVPPLKNVKKFRFRKMSRNTCDITENDVEKEILWLLRMDNCAVASKYEIIYEDPGKTLRDGSNSVDEKYIFGDIISDDSEHGSSSDMNEIIEYTN